MATLPWTQGWVWWPRAPAAPTAEALLLRRAAAGERAAVEELVERYQDSLYSIALTFTRDEYQAEDLAQEAWIRILRALPSFRAECRFSTWVYRICMNVYLNQRPNREDADPEQLERQGRSDPALARLESTLAVVQSVRRLAPEFRAVVALRYIADLSYQEIATALELPLGTVQSRLKRGIDFLKKRPEVKHESF